MLYETHSHTPLCRHAVGEPTEYASVAETQGLSGLIVTCHNPMPNGFGDRVRMRGDEFSQYLELVEETASRWAGRVDVRLGLEADFFPGYESFLEQQLNSADFHYVLGSVHPQLREYREAYWSDNPLEVQTRYFDLLATAAETQLFDCISHPDLIKNLTADDWRPAMVMDEICGALDRIAATGVAMELNTSGRLKTIQEMNPFPDMLREIQLRGIPVVIGSDAHRPDRVGDGFADAMDLLELCGFTEVNYFLNRRRCEVSIDVARASLVANVSCADD
ncbi:MAG: histidinol-phosphatase HisJ family protein [Planctomycetota bacterium]|nr:histidinol-phosphatase HisJ family protein [Planctomycetota bacterium]MDA1180430.1 histidinol-phosphatase HisJ family protein [Planctomycetota bacterium]